MKTSSSETQSKRWLDELKALLRFKSIGTDPKHAADCLDCANFLVHHLSVLGFEARLLETEGNPVVFGETKVKKEGRPTVLLYGHYDVQPISAPEEWVSDPFEPEVRDGRLYARGARDNKGQFFSMLKALEALIEQDALDLNVKVFFEGNEEGGKIVYEKQLKTWGKLLESDMLVACELPGLGKGAPALTLGLRGFCLVSFKVKSASRVLHSGHHGSRVPNPAKEVSRLIATLYEDDGRVAVSGYYDKVIPPSDKERACAARFAFKEYQYIEETGIKGFALEEGFSPVEQVWFRPSADICTLAGGHLGEGYATIIPHEARATIVMRTVPNQQAKELERFFVEHLKKHVCPNFNIEFMEADVTAEPLRVDIENPLVEKAVDLLMRYTDGVSPLVYSGASLPAMPLLVDVSQATPLLFGFGMDQDNEHGANESFELQQFEKSVSFFTDFFKHIAD